jgi:hypothetical protein
MVRSRIILDIVKLDNIEITTQIWFQAQFPTRRSLSSRWISSQKSSVTDLILFNLNL